MKTTIVTLLVALFAFINSACCVQDCDPVAGLSFQTCEGSLPVRYASIPIRVEVQDDRLFDFTVNAIETWNTEVGFEVFTMDTCEGCPIVNVSNETDETIIENVRKFHGPTTIAFASSAATGEGFCEFAHGYVRVIPGFWKNDFDQQNRTMAHEFGHVLGIRHDEGPERNTLMYQHATCSVVDPAYADHISSIYR